MKLKSVHHIAVICSDYEKSKAFYTEVLGMEVLADFIPACIKRSLIMVYIFLRCLMRCMPCPQCKIKEKRIIWIYHMLTVNQANGLFC